MTKHEKIMELGIQHCLAQIGGRAEFQGDKLVLWGACTACPLQALNVTSDIHELTEIEIDADFCPVSGCGCPLFHFFYYASEISLAGAKRGKARAFWRAGQIARHAANTLAVHAIPYF